MRRTTTAVGSGLALLAIACAPALNWREHAIDASGLVALFPCKPESATRVVSLGLDQVEMTIRSCDANGVKFAVGRARLADPGRSADMLVRWRVAALAGVRAGPSTAWDASPRRFPALPPLLAAQASGRRPDNSPVTLQGVWFARGPDVFAALIYFDSAQPDAAESFFAGLRFR